jgi:hypothetical protein
MALRPWLALAAATAPNAPAVTSNCGEAITPTGPVTTDSPIL